MARVLFLCSSPNEWGHTEFDSRNGFTEELKRALPDDIRLLFIASDPHHHEKTEAYAETVRMSFEISDLGKAGLMILDDRNGEKTRELLQSHNVVYLAGGHVPTQNAFFQQIGLREEIGNFDGVLISCSAGTMNSADRVYAAPEEPGEGIDPTFQKDLQGLGLTKVKVFPHYQAYKDMVLDGLRLFDDIVYPDTETRTLIALTDGSYILSREGQEEIRGEAYEIKKGQVRKICSDGECIKIEKSDILSDSRL